MDSGVYDVLVVDDNLGDRRFIEESLQGTPMDLRIHTVETRGGALNMLSQRRGAEGTPTPDVLLLDWNLSRETGEQVLNAAKSGDSPIPVVVMMGKSERYDESPLSQADMYIEKPTQPEGYTETLRSLLTDQ